VIQKLIEFYKTGGVKMFNEYNIEWVKDTESSVDFVDGFIVTYGDSLDIKANRESIVYFKDLEATKRTQIIGKKCTMV
jgi:dipeptidyl-peptidase-3